MIVIHIDRLKAILLEKLLTVSTTYYRLKNGLIDDSTYRGLKCTNGNLLRCYGLPKIHKPGIPLRVVVSSVGSSLYNVARYLHGILITSIKNPNSTNAYLSTFSSRL